MFYSKTPISILALVALAVAGVIDTQYFERSTTANETGEIGCQESAYTQTQRVGDGNPHQNFVYKQVSGTTDCTDNPGGGASINNGQSVTWSASISGTVGFITGGFDVAVSTSTGYTNSFGCLTTGGGSHKGSLCVFERIQLTAFTANARNCQVGTCHPNKCDPWSPNVVIYAPNNQQPSCFYDNYQVNLPCDGLGAEHYVYNGPSGGPQSISCQSWMN